MEILTFYLILIPLIIIQLAILKHTKDIENKSIIIANISLIIIETILTILIITTPSYKVTTNEFNTYEIKKITYDYLIINIGKKSETEINIQDTILHENTNEYQNVLIEYKNKYEKNILGIKFYTYKYEKNIYIPKEIKEILTNYKGYLWQK